MVDVRRIALVLGSSTGGIGQHVRMLAGELAARGFQVVVLGPAATEDTFGFRASGANFIPVEIAERSRLDRDARAVARLGILLARADVVHANGLRAGALAILATGTRRPPVVVSVHNMPPEHGGLGAVYRLLEWIVVRGATRVLAASADLEERLRERGARLVEPLFVPAPAEAPPPADVRRAVRDELGTRSRPLLVSVARLAPQKGLHTLLDAAAALAGRRPQPLLAIAGEGPLRQALEERIESERLPVRLLGHRDDAFALIAAADVVVLSSVWEARPLVLQQALRAGKPIVATDVGGVGDLVSESALLVPSADAGALEESVRRLLDDPTLAGKLAAAAAQRGASLRTENDVADQVVRVYGDVASG